MKVEDRAAFAKEQIGLCDYIDNTARMLKEKEYWRAQLNHWQEVAKRRYADLEELVG